MYYTLNLIPHLIQHNTYGIAYLTDTVYYPKLFGIVIIPKPTSTNVSFVF